MSIFKISRNSSLPPYLDWVCGSVKGHGWKTMLELEYFVISLCLLTLYALMKRGQPLASTPWNGPVPTNPDKWGCRSVMCPSHSIQKSFVFVLIKMFASAIDSAQLTRICYVFRDHQPFLIRLYPTRTSDETQNRHVVDVNVEPWVRRDTPSRASKWGARRNAGSLEDLTLSL